MVGSSLAFLGELGVALCSDPSSHKGGKFSDAVVYCISSLLRFSEINAFISFSSL